MPGMSLPAGNRTPADQEQARNGPGAEQEGTRNGTGNQEINQEVMSTRGPPAPVQHMKGSSRMEEYRCRLGWTMKSKRTIMEMSVTGVAHLNGQRLVTLDSSVGAVRTMRVLAADGLCVLSLAPPAFTLSRFPAWRPWSSYGSRDAKVDRGISSRSV